MARTSLVAAALFSSAGPGLAAPQLAAVWSDHAVVQRDAPIRVEGVAAAGERVTGSFGEAAATTQADSRGRFTHQFPPRAASSEPVST